MVKKYVLVFALNEAATNVVLVSKLRPEWQKGKLNGVGGKIEEGETPMQAALREFAEETGVMLEHLEPFGGMKFENDVMGGTAVVYLFRTFSDVVYQCHTNEEEEIVIIHPDNIKSLPHIGNLPYLISAAKDKSIKNLTITY